MPACLLGLSHYLYADINCLLRLWCLLVEVFIGIQCYKRGVEGLGGTTEMLGEEQMGRWGLERSFCQVLPTRLVQFHFETCPCILLHPRGQFAQRVGRLQEIKHLANCWGGSFSFSLSLSCQKWERRKITWERPLDLRSAAASSPQIWNTQISQV